MKKVIFTTGGTGGHIYPALSIAKKIREKNDNTEILFIGTEHRMEKDLVPAEGFRFVGLDVIPLKTPISVVKMLFAINKAIKILKEEKPTEVIWKLYNFTSIDCGNNFKNSLLFTSTKLYNGNGK